MRSTSALIGMLLLVTGGLVLTGGSASASPVPQPESVPVLLTQARTALRNHSAALKTSGADQYAVYTSRRDRGGRGIVRYTRSWHGLRVYGGDVVVRVSARGEYLNSSVGLKAPLALSAVPKVGAATAAVTAKKAFSGRITSTRTPELFIDASGSSPVLAWETVVEGFAKDGQTPSRLHVIIDAKTGKVRGSYDEIESAAGSGRGVYSGPVPVGSTASGPAFSLVDPQHGDGSTCDMHNGTTDCTPFTDDDDVWGDGTLADRESAAVDAAYGAATTFDYYSNVLGRSGILGNGSGVTSRVHYGDGYGNAFWDGTQMTYGDGKGNARPWTALDIAGHEMSHGVTENVVPGGLTYSGESGGLNEATSDIFGTMVEFYANNASEPGNYEIGERIEDKPLRYMYDPALDGVSPSCWTPTTRWLDVHYSSGIANHFFFDLAEGTGKTAYGTSPVCGTADPMRGIGRDKAAKIWFRALDAYFVSSTNYSAARTYTLSAAADLYGNCGTEYRAVQAAWSAVNVAGDDTCPPGNDFSITATPATLPVDRGATVTTSLATTLTNGSAEPLTLTAGDLPAGVTVAFAPPTITAGETSTVTIASTPQASTGSYPITLTATALSVIHTARFTLAVNSTPSCTATNGDDLPIPDRSTVLSTIDLSGCTSVPSATSTVEVHIKHPYIGDLVVSLIAPDGRAYVLHNRWGSGTHDIDQTYPLNLADQSPSGTWSLQLQDATTGDTGYLYSWTLTL